MSLTKPFSSTDGKFIQQIIKGSLCRAREKFDSGIKNQFKIKILLVIMLKVLEFF